MFASRIVASIVLALAVAAGESDAASPIEGDARLRAELERVAQERIFFGHQSVGGNLLDGIRQLATMAGVNLRMVETPAASGVGPATLGHVFVSRNGYPLQKLQFFQHAMGSQPAGLDIALVKFCYLDFTAETDAKALFARYRATIDELRAINGGTTFVHVTAPLTDVQGGIKALVKRLLGRAPYGVLENLRREEYNALLRQAYNGSEPVFDLARIESTAPDGSAVNVAWNGRIAPAMAPAYTDDGGHLNGSGRLRAARELIAILAAVPQRPTAAGRPAR